jgi:methylated-DNA-[protein]-cysteine S-methyltransferase
VIRGRLVTVTYDAPGWGTGEVVFAGDAPVLHEEPRVGAIPGVEADTPARRALIDQLRAYFAGERVRFDLDLAAALELAAATPFAADCVRAICAIPYGETLSYRELAEAAGRPGASRAAGSVCARGTLSVIVPYHRVIRSDGTLGPYGPGGDSLKRRLLDLEGVSA